MTLALHALFLILLYLPGALLLSAYWGQLSREKLPVLNLSMTGQAVAALIISILVHALVLSALKVLSLSDIFPFEPDHMGIVRLLGPGSPSGTANNAALEHFGQHLPWEAGYFVSTYAIAYGLGAFLHWMVRHWKLDRKFEALRFSNKWHYILSAEAAEFPKYADQYPDAIVYIYLTALVTIDKQPYLYAGFVDDWWFDDAGELDTVVLNDVVRYPISDGSEDTDPEIGTVSATEPKQVPIPGHFFYLRFANTLNLSVQYISYEFEDVAGDSAMLEASSDSLAATGSATS